MANKTHGMSRTPTWRSWSCMLTRCRNPCASDYQRYGGRGITVCDRWRSFENFFTDMGERPEGKTLDRINNNGNYEPGNCRWATPSEQSQNKRKTVIRKTLPHQHIQIRWLSEMGWNHGELGQQFGISRTSVRNILGNSKPRLTEQDVLAIRMADGSIAAIAREFGTSRANVRLIRARKTWAGINDCEMPDDRVEDGRGRWKRRSA